MKSCSAPLFILVFIVACNAYEDESNEDWSALFPPSAVTRARNKTKNWTPHECKRKSAVGFSWWTMGTWALTGSYALSLLLLFVYIACDEGPIHQTRLRETFYLATVLSLVYWPTSIFFLIRYICTPYRSRTSDINLEWVLFTILCLYILMRFVRSPSVPKFHSRRPDAKVAEQLPPPPRGVRVAAELKTATHKARKTTWSSAAENALVPVLISGLVGQQFMVAFSWLQEPCRIFFLSVIGVLFLMMCYDVLWRQIFRQKHINLIQESLSNLVNDGDKMSFSYVLDDVNVGMILELAGSEALEILVDRALTADLHTPRTKAILMDALQKTGLRTKTKQLAAQALILSSLGENLVTLKMLIDAGGDYHNLYKLVYNEIRRRDVRKAILQHFDREAFEYRRRCGIKGIKVVSDIDDTLCCSGGRFPRGCDTKFPKHVIYPGCTRLLKTLDVSWDPEVQSCNLIFLTARPHVFKDISEDRLYQFFEDLTRRGVIHSVPTVLPGRLWSGIKAACAHRCLKSNSWEDVGFDKYVAFMRFKRLYGEYDFIFFGDDGQGDVYAAQRMIYAMKHPDSHQRPRFFTGTQTQSSGVAASSSNNVIPQAEIRFAVIHQVLPEECGPSLEFKPADVTGTPRLAARQQFYGGSRASFAQAENSQAVPRMLYHKTYIGAALELHCLDPNLVSVDALRDITISAIQEFDQARLACIDWNYREAECDLRADIAKVEQVLHNDQFNLHSIEELINKTFHSVGRDCRAQEVSLAETIPWEETTF